MTVSAYTRPVRLWLPRVVEGRLRWLVTAFRCDMTVDGVSYTYWTMRPRTTFFLGSKAKPELW